jgi:hypothetical protein
VNKKRSPGQVYSSLIYVVKTIVEEMQRYLKYINANKPGSKSAPGQVYSSLIYVVKTIIEEMQR